MVSYGISYIAPDHFSIKANENVGYLTTLITSSTVALSTWSTLSSRSYISRSLPPGIEFRVTALNMLQPQPAEGWQATLYDYAEWERVPILPTHLLPFPLIRSQGCALLRRSKCGERLLGPCQGCTVVTLSQCMYHCYPHNFLT